MPEGIYNHQYDQKLLFLVGNIGSGKTTFIKTLNNRYVVLSRDKIRYMLGGGDYVFSYKLEDPVWRAEITLFKELLKTSINMVIDEVNTNKIMRGRYIHNMLAETWDNTKYEMTAVVFHRLSKKESVDRRMKDNHGQFDRHAWEDVWDHFDKNYSLPTLEEGFDKIVFLDKNGKVESIKEKNE